MLNHILNQIIGTKVYHFEELESTNDYASYLIAKKAPIEGTVVSADVQTKGRGQYGRKWVSSDKKNITLSVILKPNLFVQDQFMLNMFTSLAVSTMIESLVNHSIHVKWPNDIYYKNQKIAGILIQNYISSDRIKSSIIGIGLNVNQSHFHPDLPNPVSISQIIDKELNLNELKLLLYQSLNKYYHLSQINPALIKSSYLTKMLGIHERRRFSIDDEILFGEINGIDSAGRLVVTISGEKRNFSMGELKQIID